MILEIYDGSMTTIRFPMGCAAVARRAASCRIRCELRHGEGTVEGRRMDRQVQKKHRCHYTEWSTRLPLSSIEAAMFFCSICIKLCKFSLDASMPLALSNEDAL